MISEIFRSMRTSIILLAVCGCAVGPELEEDLITDAELAQIASADMARSARKPATFGLIAAAEKAGTSPESVLANMPKLKGRGIVLVQEWISSKLDDPARWAVVEQGKLDGTPVFPWLVMPPGTECDATAPTKPCDLGATKPANYAETGYYPNATNYAAWISKALALMDLWKAKGYAPSTFVVDLEPRDTTFARIDELGNNLSDLLQVQKGLGPFLQAEIDRPRYAQALAAFKTFVDEAHARKWKVHMTTILQCLDDYRDGDDALRQALNVPLDDHPLEAGSIRWDEFSFQAYRTLYEEIAGLRSSPYFVYSYGLTARSYFGPSATLDIGEAEHYDSTKLRRDMGAAALAGIHPNTLAVFSFRGIIEAPDQDWFAGPLWPVLFPDVVTAAAIGGARTVDKFLH